MSGLEQELASVRGRLDSFLRRAAEEAESGAAEARSSEAETARHIANLDSIDQRLADLESRLGAIEGDEDEARPEGDPLPRAYDLLASDSAGERERGIEILRDRGAGDSDALAALRGMLGDPDVGVRREALDALADLGDRESTAAIIDLLSDDNPGLRGQAIAALEDLYEDSGVGAEPDAVAAAEAIVDCLSDPDPDVRGGAADSLGDLRYGGGVHGLVRCLEDPSHSVREEAIVSLSEIGDPAAIPPLQGLYEAASGERALDLAIALRELGHDGPYQEQIERYAELARTAEDDGVRARALDILREHASESHRDMFENAPSDESGRVRRGEERALEGRPRLSTSATAEAD